MTGQGNCYYTLDMYNRPVELEMIPDKNRAKPESGSYEVECHP